MEFSIRQYFRSLTIADAILIMFCIMAIIYFLPGKRREGSSVLVYKDAGLWARYDLFENRVVQIDKHNTIEIKDKKAGIIFSDCPDKRCVKQGFSNSMPIICMPNKLVLRFENSSEEIKLYLQ